MIFHFCEALLAVYGLLNLSVKGINVVYQRFKNIPNFIYGTILPHPFEEWELIPTNRDWIYLYQKDAFQVQHFDSVGGSNEYSVWIKGAKFATGWRAERLFDAIKAEYCERHALNGL